MGAVQTFESLPVVNAGDRITWPGASGWYAALEDSVPDPRGTGRVILRAMTPDIYGQQRRVLTVCPPSTAEVKVSPSIHGPWLSRLEMQARADLDPPPFQR